MEFNDEYGQRIKDGELTLETVCGFLNADLPESLRDVAQNPLPRLFGSVSTFAKGGLYFACGTLKALRQAYEKGSVAVVAKRPHKTEAGENIPVIRCESPRNALIAIVALLKEQKPATTVAITGSVGKTSTKDMFRLVASSTFNTYASLVNQNGFYSVVRNVQTLADDIEVYIQEVGTANPGLVERDCTMLRQNAFVITNIGLNHVGHFDNKQENLLYEKLAVDRMAADDAVGFINYDDPLLRASAYSHPVVFVSYDDPEADYYACDIVERNASLSFAIMDRQSGQRTQVTLHVPGAHNVLNAVCAFAFGRWLNIEPSVIAEALAKYQPEGVRQHLTEVGGQKLYLDCYNASEGAYRSVINTLRTIDVPSGGKRILVAGDIDDKLGAHTEAVHRRVGQALGQCDSLDVVIAFGPHAMWIAQEALAAGKRVLWTNERDWLERFIREESTLDDLVCFKGGQQMELPRTLDNLYGTPLFLLDGDVTKKYTHDVMLASGTFRVLEGYGVVFRNVAPSSSQPDDDTAARRLVLPAEVDGETLRVIGPKAAYRSNVESIVLPEGVQAIDRFAFASCARLQEIELPRSLRTIGPNAFAECTSLRSVHIPEGVTTIGHHAFAGDSSLRDVYLPASVLTLQDDVFAGCDHAVFHTEEGSVAQRYVSRIIEG